MKTFQALWFEKTINTEPNSSLDINKRIQILLQVIENSAPKNTLSLSLEWLVDLFKKVIDISMFGQTLN